jgi:PelA/Pel-15E family pectate lyase
MNPYQKSAILTSIAGLILLSLPNPATAAKGLRPYLRKSTEWFAGSEAKQIAANVLSFQSDLGGWPKNVDTTATLYAVSRKELRPTFDNGATTDELRFLAKIFAATRDPIYRSAFDRGLAYILQSQYLNGGWPQYSPPGPKYPRHITFNDDAMVRLMEFLREVDRSPVYEFVGGEKRSLARQAFDRGVDCILKCQIKVNGRLTVWCAQHDEHDFSPRRGRSYELPSLSGSESVDIVRLLMSLDSPDPRVVRSVQGAIEWFKTAEIHGIRQDVRPDARAPKGTNKVIVKDPAAPPIWARFYEIGTNRAMFVDRDGVPKYDLAEIGFERRNGYAWLGDWPERLLSTDYPAWLKRWNLSPVGR